MKVFTFTKDGLKTDAVTSGYVPGVDEFFKALGLPGKVTVTFRDDALTERDALGVLQQTMNESWCGHADNLNEFLVMRARSLEDSMSVRMYSFYSKEKDGVTTVWETVDFITLGPVRREFRIADGAVYDMDGDILELFTNKKMF